jgi:hypothetical protein
LKGRNNVKCSRTAGTMAKEKTAAGYRRKLFLFSRVLAVMISLPRFKVLNRSCMKFAPLDIRRPVRRFPTKGI